MARIRTIKPEFWQNEELSELPAMTRLLAIGLLNHSDDEGYFRAHTSLIKAAIFPFTEDSLNIHGMLNELSNIGYICLYDGSDGKRYGQIVNFTKHQKINRPSPSKINGLIELTESSVNDHEQLTTGKERNREQGKEQGKEKNNSPAKAELADAVNAVFNFWVQTMQKGIATKITPKRKRAIEQRLKSGYTISDIQTAISNCSRSDFHMGQNDRATLYNDIELICRSDEKLEQFRDAVNAGESTALNKDSTDWIEGFKDDPFSRFYDSSNVQQTDGDISITGEYVEDPKRIK